MPHLRKRLQDAEQRAHGHALEPHPHRRIADVIDEAVGSYPQPVKRALYLPVAVPALRKRRPARSVCPTGATYKDEKGRVEIDYDKCIGCRMCMAACPFNARVFNWTDPVREPDCNYGDSRVPVRAKGVMEKCTLCKERTDDGDVPMCVRVCPARARTFGDLDDPESEISKLAQSTEAHHLLEEKGTRPQLFYIGL